MDSTRGSERPPFGEPFNSENDSYWPVSDRRYECAQPLSLRDPNGPVVSGSNWAVKPRSPFYSASALRHRLLQQIEYRNEKSSFFIVNSFGHRAERESRHPIVLSTYCQIAAT